MEFFIGGMRPESQWGQAWPGGVPDFQWLADGAKVDTNNSHHWAPGQPDNEQDGDNVLALGGAGFLLSDSRETRSPKYLGYICEK